MVDQDALGQGLFRAHVAQRAEKIARQGQAGVVLHAGQAEVGDPDVPPRVEEQVRRFDVAVDHPHLVRVLQRLGDLHAEPGRGIAVLAAAGGGPGRGKGAAGGDIFHLSESFQVADHLGEAFPLDKLHGVIRPRLSTQFL